MFINYVFNITTEENNDKDLIQITIIIEIELKIW